MRKFLDEDFLLSNATAVRLYNTYAKDQPIIDYHNHLLPNEIAENRQYENLTQLWLNGDHYKWRAMRTAGVDEKYITGDASDKEKFFTWAQTVPKTLRNPLYHWTHLELKRYFGIDQLLNEETADEIYEQTKKQLESSEFSAVGLLKKMNVEVLCTTDDPVDDLSSHRKITESDIGIDVRPTFRPDKLYAIESPAEYATYIRRLESVTGDKIDSYHDFLFAVKMRIDFFHEHGCRVADHGLEQFYADPLTEQSASAIFDSVKSGSAPTWEETKRFKITLLIALSRMYHEKGWAQQFHLGALRNTNTRMLRTLGPDTGFDSIGDFSQARALSEFLNHLDSSNQLTRTILYNLNPSDNEVMATMIGNFNDGSVAGKMQFGSGWWFLDQLDGMEKQLNALSNMGLLSQFVGMLTDSRSFLSFPRHEYFRRLLCDMLGRDIEKGHLPNDEKLIGGMIADICYRNAKKYFGF